MYREKIDAYFNQHRDKLVQDICRLININSVRGEPKEGMPFGQGPAKALGEALKIARELGFSPVNMENYVGTVDLNDKPTELSILAHLDVVSEGTGWTKEPFRGTVENGVIYGRGAMDNKGPAVAVLYALACAREIEPNLSKNARVILGTAEETGSEDIRYYYERVSPSPKTFSPDAEFPVINIEKGRYAPSFGASWEEDKALPRVISIKGGETVNAVPSEATAVVEGVDYDMLEAMAEMIEEYSCANFTLEEENDLIKITAHGKSAHASKPEEGVNALTAMLFLLSHIRLAPSRGYEMLCALNELFPHGDFYGKYLGIEQKDEISGALTLNLSVMEFSLTGFTARFDCRFPVCGTKESVSDAARAKLKAKGIEIQGAEGITMPHHTPADSPFVKTLLKAYEDYTGCKGDCIAIGGGTYVHGIEGAVAFGCTMPGKDNRIHGPDEHVSIEDIVTSAKIFAQVIIDNCK